ncbi:MAG: hypothetical protein Q7J36_06960, partial [Thiobacillus sp.]|nr:hypothetical protein [Thiobacillus sp.]
QSSGIEQVNQAVVQMDDATQQNAALVEEAAAAAESMQNQAARLAEAVSVFKLSEGGFQSHVAELPAPHRETAALPKAAASRAPASKKLAAAGAGNGDEWEEF